MQDVMEREVPVLSMIDGVHASQSASRQAAYDLQSLADAFVVTGNDKVANRLERIAESLLTVSEILGVAYNNDISRQVAESTQATHNMLNAALAGLAVGARGSERQEV